MGALSAIATFALTITWDVSEGSINIRGLLIVVVAVVILCGSVYLLLATNSGPRLGFLIAATGLMGWMTIMGVVWWVYGIGWVGDVPTWKVSEVVSSESADDLSAAATEAARDLSTWDELPEGDAQRGEAQASADEALTGDGAAAPFESTQQYVTISAFDKGGKDPDSLLSQLPGPHPTHYAIVQVQEVFSTQAVEEGEPCPPDIDECYTLGDTPPVAEVDPDAAVYSVIMVRNLGNERLQPALISVSCFAIFALLAHALHRRDKEAAANRARAEVS